MNKLIITKIMDINRIQLMDNIGSKKYPDTLASLIVKHYYLLS